MSDTIQLEAEAFDNQILERVSHGHIPDLRNTNPCEYFYNNIWRHPDYVKMYYYPAFERVLGYVRKYSNPTPKILEVGCGPGFICLELARNGLGVTGIDISRESINTARKVAESEALSIKPEYRNEGLMDTQGRYDVVLFWSSLHHFADCDGVMKKVLELLNPGGHVIVFEPTRDRVTPENVMHIYLIEQLLALTGNYYKKADANTSIQDVRRNIEKMYHLQKYETENGENLQSVNDNESGYEQMIPGLRNHFSQLEYEDGYSFFFQIVGGLRRVDAEKNLEMAKFLQMIDALMCRAGIMKPTEFYFVGQKKEH